MARAVSNVLDATPFMVRRRVGDDHTPALKIRALFLHSISTAVPHARVLHTALLCRTPCAERRALLAPCPAYLPAHLVSRNHPLTPLSIMPVHRAAATMIRAALASSVTAVARHATRTAAPAACSSLAAANVTGSLHAAGFSTSTRVWAKASARDADTLAQKRTDPYTAEEVDLSKAGTAYFTQPGANVSKRATAASSGKMGGVLPPEPGVITNDLETPQDPAIVNAMKTAHRAAERVAASPKPEVATEAGRSRKKAGPPVQEDPFTAVEADASKAGTAHFVPEEGATMLTRRKGKASAAAQQVPRPDARHPSVTSGAAPEPDVITNDLEVPQSPEVVAAMKTAHRAAERFTRATGLPQPM